MYTPSLETKHMILRPLQVADADEVYNIQNSDPEAARYYTWVKHRNKVELIEWLQRENIIVTSNLSYHFGFEDKLTRKLIGVGGIQYDENKDEYVMGYYMLKYFFRQGFIFEATRMMAEFAVARAGVKRLVSLHSKQNYILDDVMLKSGFTYDSDVDYVSPDGIRSFVCKKFVFTN